MLVGTCRGAEDEEIVKDLKLMAKDIGISESIEFKINVARNELYKIF